MQFPTPYPGELWYSIIARYHKRSGNPFWYMSIQELFDGRTNSTLITGFYPNESIIMVHDKFPNVIDLRKAVLESTLLPYLMRFYPKEKKIQAFEDFINGVNTKPRLYRYTKHDKLRYCPLCRQEDIEKYGEPYWHTVHQIELMPLCPIHRCRIREITTHKSLFSGRYTPMPEDDEPVFDCAHYEPALTDTLFAYYRMPFEASPNIESDNLARAMENAGLISDMNIRYTKYDGAKLHKALVDFYSPELIEQYFGTDIKMQYASRLRNHIARNPEQYALIATMIGLEPELIFSNERIPLRVEERLRMLARLASQGNVYSKQQVSKIAGIPTYRLRAYTERFGLEPFWFDIERSQLQGKSVYSGIRVSQEDAEILDEYMKEHFLESRKYAAYSLIRQFLMGYQATKDDVGK